MRIKKIGFPVIIKNRQGNELSARQHGPIQEVKMKSIIEMKNMRRN